MTDTTVLSGGACTVIGNAIYALANWKYIGWGTGTNPATKAATALQAEAAETATTKVTATSFTQSTVNYTNDAITAVGTVTCAGAGKTITEAGLFSANSGSPTMDIYGTFSGLPLSVGDAIQFTFAVTFT